MIFEKYGNISKVNLPEKISWKINNEPFPDPENRENYYFTVDFYFRKKEILQNIEGTSTISWDSECQREKVSATIDELKILTLDDIKQAIRDRYTSEYANLVALTEEFSGIAGLSE